jgi:fumarate reductase subunit D
LTNRLAKRPHESRLNIITRRRILYWLAATVAVVVAGIFIGLIWADTSDVAGFIALVTNIVGGVAIVVLLIALAVATRRQRQAT